MTTAGQASPAYLLYQAIWRGLDLIFPPTCGFCGQIGVRWCEKCQEQITRITGPICACCGDPLEETPGSLLQENSLCPDCTRQHPAYEALRSYGEFKGPLREALHRLKYQRDIGLGESLSKHLIELYNELKWDIELVVPVPLSAQRARERGYNQSGMLGRPLAYAIRKPYQSGALLRTRNTRSQVGLTAKERHQNVDGAFTANPEKVKGKVVLIIDDVMTTGSTINACAQALCSAGVIAVYGLTLARAVRSSDADDQPTFSQTKRR